MSDIIAKQAPNRKGKQAWGIPLHPQIIKKRRSKTNGEQEKVKKKKQLEGLWDSRQESKPVPGMEQIKILTT